MKLVDLLKYHLKLRDHLEIQDVYKLIYQTVFGIEHLMGQGEEAQVKLIKEMENIEKISDEMLLENISLNNTIVRVNLKPFKKIYNQPARLFKVMITSSELIKGKQDDFIVLWNEFFQLVKNGKPVFSIAELEKFSREMKKKKYPSVSHSAIYKEKNKPAYRVVVKNLFEGEFKTQ